MTKSQSLTTHLPSLYSGNTLSAIALTTTLSILGTGLLIAAFPLSATAENSESIAEELPPPPPLSPRNQIIKHKYKVVRPVDTEPPTYATKNQRREYTFDAPNEAEGVNGDRAENFKQYRVEVFDDAEELLEQVKDIEPRAFQKGDIIQVGIFSRQKNAEDLVRKLAVNGFWARIMTDD